MTWDVEYTDPFQAWWEGLRVAERESIASTILLLKEHGPNLPFPYSSRIIGSAIRSLRELRIQHRGKPYRVLYAFDPRRTAVLLLGGDKTGHERWYQQNVPRAEIIYRLHLLHTMHGGAKDGEKI
ncbi:type II toxin-antitoxin system RelE/ParE family toxin [Paraburkholderia sabiae]|uniref:Type II toxin-antitoxin system RelE/ParE family toxin n=1 Tax=Paraburkholderia sabiae TaxID=273251 RepID=A0ABU9Q5S1_9BURK|nr:type II toxin-antitoxin system RelE/ParE family toxin [Paraburkholderia sabiae]WJZ74325.1 type II toxin-antitoxin system RelE/ParE family toxin [Paraburkholderia sabiae]CAD6521369.1 Putative toxin HigB2 [Paraburkholderia sabiae]